MPGRNERRSTRLLLVLVGALIAALAVGAASPALAKKKKKKPVAVTTSAVAPISSGGTASATANCGGKTHLSGGGYALSPHFDPATNAPSLLDCDIHAAGNQRLEGAVRRLSAALELRLPHQLRPL
jgi:hypothetical protein